MIQTIDVTKVTNGYSVTIHLHEVNGYDEHGDCKDYAYVIGDLSELFLLIDNFSRDQNI